DVVGDPGNAYVRGRQGGRLDELRPRAGDDLNVVQREEAVADQFQAQARHRAAAFLQQRPRPLQALQSARRTDPDQLYSATGAPVLGQAVPVRIDAGRDEFDGRRPALAGAAGGLDGQEGVAGHDGVGSADDTAEATVAAAAEGPAAGIGVAQ